MMKNKILAKSLKPSTLSFPRRRESIGRENRTPAFAGVTAGSSYFDPVTLHTVNKYFLFLCLIVLAVLFSQNIYADDGPALPEGLGGISESPAADDVPGLPSGLGSSDIPADTSGPSLPAGLSGDSSAEGYSNADKESFRLPFTGFIEARAGLRVHEDLYEKDTSMAEARLQLEMEKQWKRLVFQITTDIYYDDVVDNSSINLEKGDGYIDLRKLSVSFSAFDIMDIKAGRQVLTWGTGDLVFINDMFPKDWQSFLMGRDTEYLKAPSDALKVSVFTDMVNIDVVYTPKFDSDRIITGERLSYWNGFNIAGSNSIIQADRPDNWLNTTELAVRLSKNLNGYEMALYGYRGYWKSPGGTDPVTFRYIFPELSVYGASIRGQVGKGIGNIEVGWYDSKEDRSGTNPFINNGQIRFLAGYEQDLPWIASDFTAGLQYYLEHMTDYDEYFTGLLPGMTAADENRHLFTLRLTKLFFNQNLTCSLFTYYSPSDEDLYMRPNVNYKFTDNLAGEIGANIFSGEYPSTFFGQFQDNTNIYMAVRYNF